MKNQSKSISRFPLQNKNSISTENNVGNIVKKSHTSRTIKDESFKQPRRIKCNENASITNRNSLKNRSADKSSVN